MSDDLVWPHGAPQAGQRARRSRAVTTRDIERFTEISGDRNPIHCDAAIAAATRFGGIVLHDAARASVERSAPGYPSAWKALAISSCRWSPRWTSRSLERPARTASANAR